MQNMDFCLGFDIYRDKLDKFINKHTEYNSIFEGTVNTVVNIKIPLTQKPNKLMCIEYDKKTRNITHGMVNYEDYKDQIDKKNIKRTPEHTFLVFHSGHVILSSQPVPEMEKVFNDVIKILLENRSFFEAPKETSDFVVQKIPKKTIKKEDDFSDEEIINDNNSDDE